MLTVLCLLGFWVTPTESPVVENGLNPKSKPITLVLSEDLRIGPDDGGSEYTWSGQNTAVHPDKDGRMFVVDTGGSRILLFDREGKFVQQIGGPGTGPGEFNGLRSMVVLEQGGLMALEYLQNAGLIVHFDKNLAFQKEVDLAIQDARLDSARFSYDGRWLFGTSNSLNPERTAIVYTEFLMNDKLVAEHEILTYTRAPFNGERATDPDYWRDYLAEAISGFAKGQNSFGAFDRNGLMYTAVASKYEVDVWDKTGKKIRTFKREYKPIVQTKEEVNAIVDPIFENVRSQITEEMRKVFTRSVAEGAVAKANFPPVKNPIFGLTVMENGMILVIHDRNIVDNTETADIFDREGRFLGSYKHPSTALSQMQFLNGYAYTVEPGGGKFSLVRYKVKIQ